MRAQVDLPGSLSPGNSGEAAGGAPASGRWRRIATPALILVLLPGLWLGISDGGFTTGGWTPAASFLAALLLIVSAARLFYRGKTSAPVAAAAGLLILYSFWGLLSMLWAGSMGEAYTGAAQGLIYLACFLVVVQLVALGASRRWALGASVLGTALVGVITLLALTSAGEDFFRDGRLEGGVGYFNGEAAFLLLPFWVAIYAGGSPRFHPLVRAGALTGAVVCADLALLTQSRGAMVAMAVSLPVFFALSGGRLRGLLALAPVALAAAVAFPSLNEVYLADVEGGDLGAALSLALPAIWLGALWAGLYGLAWGVIDRRLRLPSRVVRGAGLTVVAALALAFVFGVSQVYERAGGPGDIVRDKWTAFTTDNASGEDQSRYLSASGNGRINLWEVAIKDFRANPVAGIGVNNYEPTYYNLREENTGFVQHAHSLPLEVVSDRGVIGGALLGGFVAVVAATGLRQRFGRLNREGAAQFGALAAAVTYWLAHSSADWFWQLPAVSIPAFVYLGLLVAPWDRSTARIPGRALAVAGIATAVVTLGIAGTLYLSAAHLQRAADAPSPAAALVETEKARVFNPLDPRTARAEATAAVGAGDFQRAQRAYEREIRLDPRHYAPHLLLGDLYRQQGEMEKARREYERAAELNPLGEEARKRLEALR